MAYLLRLIWLLGAPIFLIFFSIASASTYGSHTETYNEIVTYSDRQCYYSYCGYYCPWWYWWGYYWWWWGWWYGGCYYRHTCHNCYVVYKTRQEPRVRCQKFWTGPNCDIPYCDIKCTNGQVCVPGNRCECRTAAGTQCSVQGCPAKSCYPGTCSTDGSYTCMCPPPFTGSNCETMLEKPEISDCRVKLFQGTREVEAGSADCEVEGHTPQVKWVGNNTFSRVEASWEAKYSYPYQPVPPASTSHIRDVKFGVAISKATVKLDANSSNPISKDITPFCRNTDTTVTEHVDCPSAVIRWTDLGARTMNDNATIEVTITAKLGGYKEKQPGNVKENFLGSSETARKVLFKIDTLKPSHCRRNSTPCFDQAISVQPDTTKSPIVNMNFSNWYDYGSGIYKYRVEIYQMLKSPRGILERPLKSQRDETITGTNRFQYTFPSPGVYSIELTVFDVANNMEKARKFMLYDNENSMHTTNEPFMVNEASKESGYKWITTAPRVDSDGMSRLTVSWKGRFKNERHVNEGWLLRIEQWTVAEGIDDNEEKLGNRTIHAIDNANGTVGFRLGFKVDKQGGVGTIRPRNFVTLNETDAENELVESSWILLKHNIDKKTLQMTRLTANDTIVIWMEAYDIIGNSVEDNIKVRFDSTPPELDRQSPVVLRENVPDSYTSSIDIKAKDMESGIEEVRYYIYDSSLRVNVTHGIAKSKRFQRPGRKRRRRRSLPVCETGSSTCYCIIGEQCFGNVIEIIIEHCDIDKHYGDDKVLQLHYTVVNQAGKSVLHNTPFLLKFPSGPPKCRPVTAFTTGTIIAVVIGLLILIAVIILVIFMVLRWKQDKHPIPDRVRTFATSVRQKITNTEQVQASDGRVIYRSKTRRGKVTEDDDDIYVDGTDPGGWRVNRDQVEMAETIAEGRFATVKKAYLRKGRDTTVVAAKYLPAGASDADKTLMKAKIAFHGNRVPPHEYIVKLLGVIDDGPVMLLEYCDMTLKEWLSKVEKVDTDVLENLLNFTAHIASGMEHLHSKSIIHRRLAMRNILLKKDGANGLVAKLIGFGSFNESSTDDQAEEATANVAVPLKWLAPETLESVGKGKAIYTQKSDVWAFGVTIWEIYSLGATPYPGKKSSETEALLKSGHRMARPDECPPELFDTVVTPCWNAAAKKRPDFKIICKMIRNFRSGGDQQEAYYAVDPRGQKQRTYDNPKERESGYMKKGSGGKGRTSDNLYDDTRK